MLRVRAEANPSVPLVHPLRRSGRSRASPSSPHPVAATDRRSAGPGSVPTARPLAVPIVLGLGLGALVGIAAGRLRADAPGANTRGAPLVWIADRDGDRVTLLDGALLPLSSVALRSPRLLTADGEGAWVAHATDGDPGRAHRLLRLTERGRIAALARFAFPVRDLAADGHGGAFLVEDRPVEARIWRLDAVGGRRTVLDVAGALRIAPAGERVLVACARGELVLVDAGQRPAILARRRVGTRIVDVAGRPGGFWALDASFGGRLLRLGEELAVLGATGASCAAAELVGGADGAWLAEREWPRVLRFDRRGVLVSEGVVRGLRTGVAALALGSGSLVLATEGAVWLCDPETGTARRTQGGFDGIVGLALAGR